MNNLAKTAALGLLLLLGGCSSTPEENQDLQANEPVLDERDPFEQTNRPIFDFNWKVLDAHVLKPAAKGYQKLPVRVRGSLLNAAENLDEPVNVVNNVFQAKFKDASVSTGRFLINSTVGLFGLLDVAGEIGLKHKKEDFAQTLGVWGADQGAYLMIPVLGPSTVKDFTGDTVDRIAFSLGFLELPTTLIKLAITTLDTRVELMDQERLLNDSIDPYSFTKEAYLQRQQYKEYDGNVPESYSEDEYEDLDEYDDEDEDEDEDLDEEDESR